jgi:hypothetical protein
MSIEPVMYVLTRDESKRLEKSLSLELEAHLKPRRVLY